MIYLKNIIASKKIEDTVELEIEEGKVKEALYKAFKHTLVNKMDLKKEVIDATNKSKLVAQQFFTIRATLSAHISQVRLSMAENV